VIESRRDLGERLLEYGARIIKLVECLPNTLVGRRVGDLLLPFDICDLPFDLFFSLRQGLS